MRQRCLEIEKAPDFSRKAVLFPMCFESNYVLFLYLDLGSVLDQDDAFPVRDELDYEIGTS